MSGANGIGDTEGKSRDGKRRTSREASEFQIRVSRFEVGRVPMDQGHAGSPRKSMNAPDGATEADRFSKALHDFLRRASGSVALPGGVIPTQRLIPALAPANNL